MCVGGGVPFLEKKIVKFLRYGPSPGHVTPDQSTVTQSFMSDFLLDEGRFY